MDEDATLQAAVTARLEALVGVAEDATMARLHGAELLEAQHARELQALEDQYQAILRNAAAGAQGDADRVAAAKAYEEAVRAANDALAASTAAQGVSTANAAIGAASSLSGLAGLDPTGITGAVVAGLQAVADTAQGGGALGEVDELLEAFADGLPSLGPVVGDIGDAR